jgi:catechol 2,3-dioxygenase-like lactoylglutathione lyase family enzyme
MSRVHHSAICVRDVDASLRFWRDGLGFDVLMDERFEGDWPTLLHAPSSSLRAVFLGDPANPESGIVELVDLGPVSAPPEAPGLGQAAAGFLLVSIMTDVTSTLQRLEQLGLGGVPRRIDAMGIAMAVVTDPDGVLVELIDSGAATNLERLTDQAAAHP